MSEPQYKRVLLKLSGEALAGEGKPGPDFEMGGGGRGPGGPAVAWTST